MGCVIPTHTDGEAETEEAISRVTCQKGKGMSALKASDFPFLIFDILRQFSTVRMSHVGVTKAELES